MIVVTENDWIERISPFPIVILNYGGSGKSKTKFKCKICSNVWDSSLSSVYKRKSGCSKCAGNKPLSENECILKLKGRNVTMLKYAGSTNSKKSTFKCLVCNHHWETSFASVVKSKHGCAKCAKILRKDEDYIIDLLNKNNIELIQYFGNTSGKSILKCKKCNYQWESSISNITLIKNKCIRCSGLLLNIKTNDAIDLLKNYNIKILHYDGAVNSNKSKFKCEKCNNIWNAKFSSIYKKLNGCPECAKSGIKLHKPTWLYILLLSTEYGYCYGIGITNNIETRMKRHRTTLKGMIDYVYPPIYFDSGIDAKKIEDEWCKSKHLVRLEIEGFKRECLLVNSETTKMIFG